MDKQLVIVIGLPGSGKTTICQKLISYHGYIIFDDFLNNFYDGKILKKLKSGIKICINDPRLCQYLIFEKYISILEQYVDHENIHLVIFENNPDQCIKNIFQRKDNKKGLKNTIIKYSQMYFINNYTRWNHEIITVYRGWEQ